MTLLNSLSLDNALNNTQQNSSAAQAKATATGSATTTATTENQQEATSQTFRKTVALSERAQKIQKLNEEFFQGGPRSVRISDTLIERLREYGFLDAQESNQLLNTLNSNKQQEEDSTVGQLADFVEDFRDTLGESEIEQSLAATLNKTYSILDNLDGTRPSALSNDITTVAAELKQYLNSDQAADLSSHQRNQLQQVSLALKIADSLNPENLSSSKVNRYLNVLGGSY